MSKDIAHLLAHPEDIDPHDTETLAKLMALDGGEPPPTEEPKAEQAPAAPAEAKPEEAPKEEAKVEPPKADTPAAEPEPEGVLAHDGKSVIPYAVLQEARRTVQALKDENEKLSSKLVDRAKSVEPPEEQPDKPVAEIEQQVFTAIDKLKEDAPWISDPLREALKPLIGVTKSLEAKLERATERAESASKVVAANTAEAVQQAIDSIPQLAAWQAESGDAWERALAFDETLQKSPAWSGKSMQERFERITELVAMSQPSHQAAAKNAPTADPKEIAKAAEAKLKSAQMSPPISTLSDLPGGASPAQTEVQKVDAMSTSQIAAMFDKMSPDQKTAYLASLG